MTLISVMLGGINGVSIGLLAYACSMWWQWRMPIHARMLVRTVKPTRRGDTICWEKDGLRLYFRRESFGTPASLQLYWRNRRNERFAVRFRPGQEKGTYHPRQGRGKERVLSYVGGLFMLDLHDDVRRELGLSVPVRGAA